MRTLIEGAKRLRFDLSERQIEAFRVYYEEMMRYRERADLTSLTDPAAVQRRHFLESLAFLRAIESAGAFGAKAIDIGSGAGFPGLPIKIVRPELALTLLEATGRKAEFLRHVVEALDLTGVDIVQGRAEEVAHEPERREAYDLALARAVAPLPTLVELALPFVRVGGLLAAQKGSGAIREVEEAARALEVCGGHVERFISLDLPGPGPVPNAVLIRKLALTPAAYPRRAGMPSKHPLR